MLALDYQMDLQAENVVPFPVAQQQEDRYPDLVGEFEETAAVLLARVDEAIDDAHFFPEIVEEETWQREALFLAQELTHLPWLLVNMNCPPRYATLKLLYAAWAKCCGDLGDALHSLATIEGGHPVAVRVCFADEDFAAVSAHTVARKIYLKSLS